MRARNLPFNRLTFGLLVCFLAIFLYAQPSYGATFTVNNTDSDDDGVCDADCSLLEAVTAANASGGADVIEFSIPGAGPHTISPNTSITLNEQTTIDGSSEPGSDCGDLWNNTRPTLNIVIDGSNLGGSPINLFQINGGSDGSIIRGLVLQNNNGNVSQLDIGADNITFTCNYFGLSQDGESAASMSGGPIRVTDSLNLTVGGTSAGDGNVFGTCGNGFSHIGFNGNSAGSSAGATIQGNFIGSDRDGETGIASSCGGISLDSSATSITIGGTSTRAKNLISGNSGSSGIVIGSGASTSVLGNYIGVDRQGTSAVPNGTGISVAANSITIGGTGPGEGNIISGNSGTGINVNNSPAVSGLIIQGNFIGTDISGTLPLGNGNAGLTLVNATGALIGGTTANTANVFAANTLGGIFIGNADGSGTGNIIRGNYIGVDTAQSVTTLGNTLAGIGLDLNAAQNIIGGITTGAGNIIAQNNGAGVAFIGTGSGTGESGNSIRGNSIFANDNTGTPTTDELGIDIGTSLFSVDGVTPNDDGDPDTGPNGFQNFPLITSTTSNASNGTTTVVGTLNSTASSTFDIDFYSNTTQDGSGNGEGETYVGSTSVTTDSSGDASFSVELLNANSGVVSATATSSDGSTSEFSGTASITQLYNISGTVTDTNGDPVSGATVTATTGSGSFNTTTDASGNYSLDDFEDGSVEFSVTKAGRTLSTSTETVSGADISNADFTAPANLQSPAYLLWDGFLDIQNFAAIANTGNTQLNGSATLVTLGGEQFSQQIQSFGFSISASGNREIDLPVNALNGFSKDSYGFLELSFNNSTFDGHGAYYRFEENSTDIEFATIFPFADVLTGTNYVMFNTYQPSANLSESDNLVASWLSLVNTDQSNARTFTLRYYDEAGALLFTRSQTVPAFGRVDVQAGHENPGPGNVGIIEIVPENGSMEYLAQIFRYGGNAPQMIEPMTFSFATSCNASAGSSETQFLPISSGGAGSNWVTVGNPNASSITVTLEFFGNTGGSVNSTVLTIPGRSQQHVFANTFVPNGLSGVVKLTSSGGAYLAKSAVYFQDADSGSITAAYSADAEQVLAATNFSFYNLYLDYTNWIRLFNTTSSSITVTLTFRTDSGDKTHNLTLAGNRGIDLNIESLGLSLSQDTLGLVTIDASESGALFATLLRVKFADDNINIDSAESIPAR